MPSVMIAAGNDDATASESKKCVRRHAPQNEPPRKNLWVDFLGFIRPFPHRRGVTVPARVYPRLGIFHGSVFVEIHCDLLNFKPVKDLVPTERFFRGAQKEDQRLPFAGGRPRQLYGFIVAIHFNSIAIGVGSELISTVVRHGWLSRKYSA